MYNENIYLALALGFSAITIFLAIMVARSEGKEKLGFIALCALFLDLFLLTISLEYLPILAIMALIFFPITIAFTAYAVIGYAIETPADSSATCQGGKVKFFKKKPFTG